MATDEDAVVNVTMAAENINNGDPNAESDGSCLNEMGSSNGEGMREVGSAGEILTRVELDLAYLSEKLLNLDILVMHVAARESDYENLAVENEDISADSVEKGLEFDFLSGILESEVTELEKIMASLRPEILDVRQKISSCEHLTEYFIEMEEKLHDSEESLKQSQDQVAEIRMQSMKFQRTLLAFAGQENWNSSKDADVSENGQFSYTNAKFKMHTVEQQRHILRMLEKSLARELDLEKKLSDSRLYEEELKQKLDSSEQEVFCMDEAAEDVWARLFAAENAAEVLLGASKELMGRLQIAQFNLNGSIQREGLMKSKLQDTMEHMKTRESALQGLETSRSELDNFLLVQIDTLKAKLKEAEDKCILSTSEAFTLREKVNSLEEQLIESEAQLQNAKDFMEESQEKNNMLNSELVDMKNVILDLKENTLKAESRAESAESKCSSLTVANVELSEELGFLKGSVDSKEKVNLLEKQLRESDIQLQHAKASSEASQEQQNMLYSAIEDMENLIEDLKLKVSKAESRAESAEVKCALISETNLELNEELSFLRGRMECLEKSLHQADDAKMANAKEISTRTKIITDLMLQLALERERLQKQISSLTKQNKVLVEKLWKTKKDATVDVDFNNNESDQELFPKDDCATTTGTKAPEEEVIVSSATIFQMNKSAKDAPVCEIEVEPSIYVEDAAAVGESNLETGSIDAGQLNSKYFVLAILILLISVLAVYLFQQERCPF